MVIYYFPLCSYGHIWTQSNAFYPLFAKSNKVYKLKFILFFFLLERMRILKVNENSNCY